MTLYESHCFKKISSIRLTASRMNQNLWNQILQFDFDNPPSEYCFSVRLADENYWTKNFTGQAILEYHKFRYMAATSEYMGSPSAIVDAVWHQQLIFTQSYAAFCKILGKTVQHVPSTHTREEFSTFRQAKERTMQLYKENFGAFPQNIWGYSMCKLFSNWYRCYFYERSWKFI